MSENYEEKNGVYGGVEFEENTATSGTEFHQVIASELPIKNSPWTKIKAFLFKEIDLTAPIKVELTPYQQKVEDEINEFLHQEISFKGFFNLVFDKKN